MEYPNEYWWRDFFDSEVKFKHEVPLVLSYVAMDKVMVRIKNEI